MLLYSFDASSNNSSNANLSTLIPLWGIKAASLNAFIKVVVIGFYFVGHFLTLKVLCYSVFSLSQLLERVFLLTNVDIDEKLPNKEDRNHSN